jgi:hypothetical protein
MPHECTSCGRVFQDGSKEMLSGCPECGGNKFQYRPGSGAGDGGGPRTEPRSDEAPGSDPDVGTGAAGTDAASADAASTDAASDSTAGVGRGERDGDADRSSATDDAPDDALVERRSGRERDGAEASDRAGAGADADGEGEGAEDSAQADARGGVVTPEELDAVARGTGAADATGEAAVGDEDGDGDDRPSIDQLRQELNDQFESIRIVSPGKYELNLMELYNREEYVISLQEDGRYVIEVPESWRRPDDG